MGYTIIAYYCIDKENNKMNTDDKSIKLQNVYDELMGKIAKLCEEAERELNEIGK